MLTVSDSFSPLPEFGHRIQQAVMPIITRVDGEFTPLGTGFVIGADGLIMTAAHVIEEAYSRRVRRINSEGNPYDHYELYALYVTDELNSKDKEEYFGGAWPIDRVWCTEELDIGLCWLRSATKGDEPVLFPVMSLSPGLPKPGENILGFGYYGMKAHTAQHDSDNQIVVQYSQETAFTRGQIVEVYPVARDSGMLSFPCFHTDARFESGMSGGPIFNEAGNICGVICSAMPPVEDDPRYISYGSLIWPAMGISIEATLHKGAPPEAVLVYDLVRGNYIATDETIANISIDLDPNGKRIVSIRGW